MSERTVLVAVCSVGAGVMGLIAGLLIMFVIKNCQKARNTTDAEKCVTVRRESFPREYCSGGGAMDTRPPGKVVSVAPIMSDGESGVYCRISKFDFPVVTEDAAIQTNEGDADQCAVKSDQATQCVIISACPPPPPSSWNQSTSSTDPKCTMSYSTYRDHVTDAFSTWQVLPSAAMTSQTKDSNKDWSHPKLGQSQHTDKAARQNEAADDDSSVLLIKLTSKVRTFLHMNGLCDTMSSAETPVTTNKTRASPESYSRPPGQIVTLLRGSCNENTANDNSWMVNTLGKSGTVLEADDLNTNDEDYLPMDCQNGDDYLPMKNLSENDEYYTNLDSYSYLSSLQRKNRSTKQNIGCSKVLPDMVTSLPVAYGASGRCNECLDAPCDQKTRPYSTGSENEYACVSEDEDYLPMTKEVCVDEDYYNCNHLKEDDDEYIPVDELTLPRRCGVTTGHSSYDSDYANYQPRDRHPDERADDVTQRVNVSNVY